MGDDEIRRRHRFHPHRFQSTSPRGGRPTRAPYQRTKTYFNPRPRVGDDHGGLYTFAPAWKFQSTSPRGGRLTSASIRGRLMPFQSTSPRGGRRQLLRVVSYHPEISIHVPAWGTTRGLQFGDVAEDISIHVPAWGTTHRRGAEQRHRNHFNPRPRVGDDSKTAQKQGTAFPFRIPFSQNPVKFKFLFSILSHLTASNQRFAVRTSWQIDVLLGFAPATWGKRGQKSWTRLRPAF